MLSSALTGLQDGAFEQRIEAAVGADRNASEAHVRLNKMCNSEFCARLMSEWSNVRDLLGKVWHDLKMKGSPAKIKQQMRESEEAGETWHRVLWQVWRRLLCRHDLLAWKELARFAAIICPSTGLNNVWGSTGGRGPREKREGMGHAALCDPRPVAPFSKYFRRG